MDIQSEGGDFARLPREIRVQIYGQLLTTTSPIKNLGELVRSKMYFTSYLEQPDLDARILRTCRLIYTEALPILYGENDFHFDTLESLETFRSNGLATGSWIFDSIQAFTHVLDIRVPRFGFKKNPHGRLKLVKKLCLQFHDTTGYQRHSAPKDLRKSVFGKWEPFFHEKERPGSPKLEFEIKFPALEDLTLDCRGLALGREGLATAALIAKFESSVGLTKLAVVGVEHEKTLSRLADGLLRKGGTYVVNGVVCEKIDGLWGQAR
ncbi:MAG: hypothetical protein Q9208_005204 [Pyrenodesmia sp. 3 TL-2023]